jgi:small-conductance mechanosensitive channel
MQLVKQIENLAFVKSTFRGPWWHHVFLGNEYVQYLFAFIAFLVFVIILKIVQLVLVQYLERISQKTSNDLDDTLIEIIKTFRPSLYLFLSFYLALRFFIALSPVLVDVINGILVVLFVYQIVESVHILVKYSVKKYLLSESDPGAESMVQILSIISRVVLWIVGILVILSNFSVNITSLVAGLGVGGIAIGLALQPILSDLFSAFTIYFDKPIEVGDFVMVGDQSGTVERIGVKTTRFRALNGEEIVMSNSRLTNTVIHNYQAMAHRRIVFHFGVTYETGIEKLREIPNIVENIIKDNKNVSFGRAHFQQFDASALTYEVVYTVNSKDYAEFMDVQQQINFSLCEEFNKKGIDMAYPTQTVYQYNIEASQSEDIKENKKK